MQTHNMEYNSQKEELIIPEYGRNVQMLIQHAKSIEDDGFRQAFVDKVVDLMHQMHPQNRNIEDYRAKLWKHVFRIADYDLDVEAPDGIQPDPASYRKVPEKINYPSNDARFRHYGSNVQTLIKKALSMEEGPKKEGFILVIGNYMKLAYRTWNKEPYVSDEVIKQDLMAMSNGKLEIDENISLENLGGQPSGGGHRRSSKKDRKNQNNGSYGRDHRGRKGGGRRRK